MVTKEYSNGEVTIVWESGKCIHAGNCARGLPEVFQPKERPWIKADAATTNSIIDQVKQCPSGALSFYMNAEGKTVNKMTTKIEVMTDGPILVHGNVKLVDAKGNVSEKENVTALCRCGASSNKPYCDGQHKKIDFKAD